MCIKGLERVNKNSTLSWEDAKKFRDIFENKIRGIQRTSEQMIGEAYVKHGIIIDLNYIERILMNKNFIMPTYRIMQQWVTVSKNNIDIQELSDIFSKYTDVQIKRGEIWYVDLGLNSGSEQSGVRPCVVIQNDVGNKHSPTISVAPLGTYRGRKLLPTQTVIKQSYETGLNRDSVVMCEQLTPKDKTCFLSKIGEVSFEDMKKINICWKIQLGDYTEIDRIKDEAEKNPDGFIAKGFKKLIDAWKKFTDDISA